MTRRMRLPRTAAHRRLTRTCAVAAIAVSTLGLSACQWTSPITTQLQYDPSDGTSVDVGSVRVQNALIVAAAANGPGTLVGAVENLSRQRQSVQISIGETPVRTLEVPAGQVVVLGADDPTVIPKVPAEPGALTEIRIQAGGSAAAARIPVLLPRGPYEGLAPTATARSSVPPARGATPDAPGTAAPTASPTS